MIKFIIKNKILAPSVTGIFKISKNHRSTNLQNSDYIIGKIDVHKWKNCDL